MKDIGADSFKFIDSGRIMLIEETSIANVISHLSTSKLNILMVGEDSDLDINKLIDIANTADIKIAGGVFPGVLYKESHYKKGIILKQFELDTQIIICESLKDCDVDIDLFPLNNSFSSLMILVDGLSNKIPSFLENIYEKYWNKINYLGGGAGNSSHESKPCLFTNKGFFKDGALLIYLNEKIQVGVKHGWEKIAGPFVITKSEENIIHEINWKPAFEVYKEVLNSYHHLPIEQNNFSLIAKGFPFGINCEGYEDIVRAPINLFNNNSIICVGEVNKNTSVNILKGNKANLINSAYESAQIAIKNIEPSSVFAVSCISRVLYLGQDFKKETEILNNVFRNKNKGINLEGILSLGEISTHGEGYLEFFNKSVLVAAFH